MSGDAGDRRLQTLQGQVQSTCAGHWRSLLPWKVLLEKAQRPRISSCSLHPWQCGHYTIKIRFSIALRACWTVLEFSRGLPRAEIFHAFPYFPHDILRGVSEISFSTKLVTTIRSDRPRATKPVFNLSCLANSPGAQTGVLHC